MSAQVSDIEAELERLRALKNPPRPVPMTREEMRARDRLPHASIARSGSRFTWAVWANFDHLIERTDPVADGRAGTKEEAEAQVRARFPDFVNFGSGPADQLRHRRAVERRAAKPATGASETKPVELLYRFAYWPIEGWQAHRLVNRTETRLYIAREPFVPNPADKPREGWRAHEVCTCILDRQAIETTGRAGSVLGEFFTAAAMSRVDPTALGGDASCLVELGLTWPTSIEEVRRSFKRLVKKVHPDHGGKTADFLKLRASYQAALAMVGDT